MSANRHTTLLSALLFSLALSACGGDKATEPTASAETKTQTTNTPPATPAPAPSIEQPQANADTPTAPSDAPEPNSTPPKNAQDDISTDPQVLAMGKARYEQTCKLCHTQGLLNAPKPDDKNAWQPRLAKGIETLRVNAVGGFGKMPAQAIDGVSEQEVRSAVDYMVSQLPK